jgi:hypothetical protein
MCGLVLIGGMYAGGFSGCLKQRMKQSLDVATFVEEFKDILVALLNLILCYCCLQDTGTADFRLILLLCLH